MFSFLLSLPLNRITHQSITLTTMSSSEPERTPDVPSSPIARKQRNWNAFPVTPSPTKDCGSKHPFVDNEPFCNAWKTSRTTPPTKVTDDTSTPRRNNKWKRCDIKHRTKKQDQQIRSIILENSVVPPAHAQRVYWALEKYSFGIFTLRPVKTPPGS